MTDILARSRHLWDGHARRDPLWAILSDPAKKGGRWDLQRFFQTGVGEISLILYRLRSHGVAVEHRRALDFGCGVGRLSQSLVPHFARVDGVDISPAMIDLARSLNRHGEQVSYHANDRPDLSLFADGTFDFIVTSIVLQHIEPVVASRYLAELCRVLAAGGALVFQVPARHATSDDPPAAIWTAVFPMCPTKPTEPCFPSPTHTRAKWDRARSGFWRSSTQRERLRVVAGGVRRDSRRQPLVRCLGLRDGDCRRWTDRVPEPLYPGDRCKVALTITAPRDCGDYWCEIDLAHEGVVWFRERGSAAVRFPVRVLLDAREARPRQRSQTGAVALAGTGSGGRNIHRVRTAAVRGNRRRRT